MADALNMTSTRRITDENIALPAIPDPRVMLAFIVHDFNLLLTPIASVLEEKQGHAAGTARQLNKIAAANCRRRAKS